MLGDDLKATWTGSVAGLDDEAARVFDWMSEKGRGLCNRVSGKAVAISIEEDRLKREVKLERLDFELSERTGAFLVGGGVTEARWSVDEFDEE